MNVLSKEDSRFDYNIIISKAYCIALPQGSSAKLKQESMVAINREKDCWYLILVEYGDDDPYYYVLVG